MTSILPSPADPEADLVYMGATGTGVTFMGTWTLTLDGGVTGRLLPAGGRIRQAVWSGDGRQIAFTTMDPKDLGTGRLELHVAALP